MEKQWQIDDRNPDFQYVRKAWRKCLSALWERIWKKMNSKKTVISSYLAADEVSQSLYDSTTSSHVIEENSEYPAANAIGDVFMCAPNKHTDSLNAVDVGINPYPEIDILEVSSKRKTKRSVEIPPFPDDLRHFRYLPVRLISTKNNVLGDSNSTQNAWFGTICEADQYIETSEDSW